MVTYEQQNNPGTAFVSGTIPATGGDTSPYTEVELGGSPVSGDILGIDKLKLERDVFDVNLTVELPLSDALTLTSVNGYRRFEALEIIIVVAITCCCLFISSWSMRCISGVMPSPPRPPPRLGIDGAEDWTSEGSISRRRISAWSRTNPASWDEKRPRNW